MNIAKKILTGLVFTLFWLVCAILLFNLFLNFRYYEFYSNSVSVGEVAGISDGLVHQGIDYVESESALLTSGYMNDGSASRIYVSRDGETTYTKLLTKDGKDYTGHSDGIAHYGNYLYVGAEDGIDVFSLADVLEGKDTTKQIDKVELLFSAAWICIEDGLLYTGRFAEVGNKSYPPKDEHIIESPVKKGEANCSVFAVYNISNTAEYGIENKKPLKIYSCVGKVQGACFTEDGELILSTSWGIDSSVFYFYNINRAKKVHTYLDEDKTPVYFLGTDCLTKTLEGPPMSEEIIVINNRLYIMNESASKKYIFGNLIGGRELYAYNLK